MIPFSPPRIDDKVTREVTKALLSGWITTGPRTKEFEKRITQYCGCKTTVAVNSWTMGMQVFLHWWGIGEGDEVIIPAYTYCASANVIMHSGAKPVMVDTNSDDFNLNLEAVKNAITPRTKAIIGVDIGGLPVDYGELINLVSQKDVLHKFNPANNSQKKLGRILIIADAAHSFGATVNEKRSGSLADVTGFSFHAVKNLTTAEGGALCFNLPNSFDYQQIYKEFCVQILHGQSKDALAKTKIGNWKYDVEEPGFKCNMTDLQAAIGLVELERYEENLARRKKIFTLYDEAFKEDDLFTAPKHTEDNKVSSYHLYLLRVNNANESERDAIIQKIFEQDVSVNVHFQPLPLLTAYKKRGYDIGSYPNAYENYANEISLPVYFNLSDESVEKVIKAVRNAVNNVMS